MRTTKTLGIWMDYVVAHLIDTHSKKNNQSLLSKITFDIKKPPPNESKHLTQNKEKQLKEGFYKKIGIEILEYEQVLLFGPTNAKIELRKFLRKDVQFIDKKIDTQPADKMTENEKIAFVKMYFQKAKTNL